MKSAISNHTQSDTNEKEPLIDGHAWDDGSKSLTEMIQELEQELPLVEYRDGEFIFYDERRSSYAFDADRCDTNAKLLEWIRHMTEKCWVTGLHINQFLKLAVKHQPQVKIDYHA